MTSKRNPKNTGGHKVLNGALCLLAIFMINIIVGDAVWAQAKVEHKQKNLTEQKKSVTADKKSAKKTDKKTEKKPSTKPSKIKPTIPGADRHKKGRVFLEYCDRLYMDPNISTEYQVLSGNVKFRKGDMFMYCDSAYYFDQRNSLWAFSNVKMEQGDTLFVYADRLYYDGQQDLARLRDHVRMENRNVTLFTDSLDYDMLANIGYYFEGGKIVDDKNELTSVYGQYAPDTKDTEFLFDVEMTNEKFVLRTDTLFYNTDTHVADITGYTTIVSDSSVVYTDKGWYDTQADRAVLYNRSIVVSKDNQKLTGDTIFYNRATGFGEVFGNMVLVDSAKCSTISGGYGYYNEVTGSTFATKRALAMEYSKQDTLFLHGDTIRSYLLEDSSRVMCAHPKVRFYRVDVQGLCDSMTFVERDSMLWMHRHPILWNEEKQVSGNVIQVHFNDSTVDVAYLPEYGMLAEHVADEFYNQLYGKEMTAYFENQEMRRLEVSGNVQAILLPMENDSTYNKLVNAEGSFLTVDLKEQKMDRLRLWPDVTGKVTPIYLSKKSQYYLKGFQWHDDIRPKDKYDIFDTPKAMDEYINSPESIAPARRIREEGEN